VTLVSSTLHNSMALVASIVLSVVLAPHLHNVPSLGTDVQRLIHYVLHEQVWVCR
jgi:hypothetical protein